MRLLVTAGLFVPLVCAQDSAADLLKKVAATYRGLAKTTYEFEQLEIREHGGDRTLKDQSRTRIVGSGSRYREDHVGGVSYIYDGQTHWTYSARAAQYSKRNGGGVSSISTSLLNFTVLSTANARFLPDEILNLGSGPVNCRVVVAETRPTSPGDSVRYGPWMYWIDDTRNLILKVKQRFRIASPEEPNPPETVTTVLFEKAVVGSPVDESLLRFDPPAGTELVEHISFLTKSPLIGSSAPEFRLKTDDGQVITPASLRGRVVLLQFAPHAEDVNLPFLELAHRQLRANGLSVICVVRSGRLDSKAYSLPVVYARDDETYRKFGFTYSGLVLLDRDGKVVYTNSLSHESPDLVRQLQKLGIW